MQKYLQKTLFIFSILGYHEHVTQKKRYVGAQQF